jgi:hypothetical protein
MRTPFCWPLLYTNQTLSTDSEGGEMSTNLILLVSAVPLAFGGCVCFPTSRQSLPDSQGE